MTHPTALPTLNQRQQLIRDQADLVRNKLAGGTVFGVPMDMTNPDHLIVAAYYYLVSLTAHDMPEEGKFVLPPGADDGPEQCATETRALRHVLASMGTNP